MFAKVFVLLLDRSLKIFSLLDNNKSDSIRSPSVWQEIEFSVWVPGNIETHCTVCCISDLSYLCWPPVLEARSTALRTVTISSSLARSYQVFTWRRHPRLRGGERDLARSASTARRPGAWPHQDGETWPWLSQLGGGGDSKSPLSLWRPLTMANFTHNPAPASPFKMRFRNMIFDLKKATPLLLTATLRTEKLFLVQWAGSICDQGNSNTISPPPKYHHDHHPDDVFPERDLSPE